MDISAAATPSVVAIVKVLILNIVESTIAVISYWNNITLTSKLRSLAERSY